MLALMILFLICLSSGMAFAWYAITQREWILFIISILLLLVSGGLIIEMDTYNYPTALDVYRGRTTIQITYQDSIPVDTVVVFKIK